MYEFDKQDKTFASDLYLIYKRSPSARVCISDKDQLLMFYLSHTKRNVLHNVKTALKPFQRLSQLFPKPKDKLD